MNSAPRVLFIRGGALGDFILTLPALALVREAFPQVHLEVLGYPHIASLVDQRYYANAVRSVNAGPMAVFFAKNAALPEDLSAYFEGFHQVISYLYDPDRIFEENLARAGVKRYLSAFRGVGARHAAREWAAPLESLALYLEEPTARLYPSEEDRLEATRWLGPKKRRLALHPGSGSPKKNWPLAGWVEVGRRFLGNDLESELVLVGGEADEDLLNRFQHEIGSSRVREARCLPLTMLAAILEHCGCVCRTRHRNWPCRGGGWVPMHAPFGPTDPAIWAPLNAGVNVLKAPEGDWSRLSPKVVLGSILMQSPLP